MRSHIKIPNCSFSAHLCKRQSAFIATFTAFIFYNTESICTQTALCSFDANIIVRNYDFMM